MDERIQLRRPLDTGAWRFGWRMIESARADQPSLDHRSDKGDELETCVVLWCAKSRGHAAGFKL
jgi:hypothetical protein